MEMSNIKFTALVPHISWIKILLRNPKFSTG